MYTRKISKQSTLSPNWVTLECTKNNSTGPHKPMNIIRDSLLAKITWGGGGGLS